MRESIKKIINETIVLNFSLPYKDINKISISSLKDHCYKKQEYSKISELIYQSLVDYCLNETDIDITNLDNEQSFALKNYLRFNENWSDSTKMKSGFFGEVLLNSILLVKFGTNKIIARGQLYDPTSKSETTGFDSFHFVFPKNEKDSPIIFYFGEVKMYSNFNNAIDSVLFENDKQTPHINKILSKEYLDNNFSLLFKRKNDFDNNQETNFIFKSLIEKWRHQSLNLLEEINLNKIKIIYPIFIFYDSLKNDYEENIKKNIENIENKLKKFNLLNEINADIFFALFPQESIKDIKRETIKWITERKKII